MNAQQTATATAHTLAHRTTPPTTPWVTISPKSHTYKSQDRPYVYSVNRSCKGNVRTLHTMRDIAQLSHTIQLTSAASQVAAISHTPRATAVTTVRAQAHQSRDVHHRTAPVTVSLARIQEAC